MSAFDSKIVAADASDILPDPFFKKDERPYVGLRTFEQEDRRYFCGRSAHVKEVIERLNHQRLVAVVGLSGSGKSSLVRAGVIPELYADRLKDASSDWLIAMATPANDPLTRMGDKLKAAVKEHYAAKRRDAGTDCPTEETIEEWAAGVHDALQTGSLGLAKAIATAELKRRTRVLLIVDQFEELFRYWKRTSRDGKDEVEVFIQQLLELTSDPDGRVYVIITMRSDYLGDCARYEGLAEAVNSGLYLTPRLNREQLREAIEVPAQKCRRTIAPEFVHHLINDVVNDQDQLPILQHALMRCWEKAQKNNSKIIDVAQYVDKEIGGPNALDVHGEEIYSGLAEDVFANHGQVAGNAARKQQQDIAEALFKRITKRATGPADEERKTDGTRDATKLETICLETGFKREDIVPVINAFRERNRAFLRPGEDEAEKLEDDSVIDITHESLIRKWNKLGKWVKEESDYAHLYLQLSEEAAQAAPNEFLSQSKLNIYTEWQESKTQNANWARRYGGSYERAITYLAKSRDHQKWEKWRRWGPIGIVTVIAIVLLVVSSVQKAAERSRVLDFERTAKVANSDGISTTFRVPAAIADAV
jgi:hypothetical protein